MRRAALAIALALVTLPAGAETMRKSLVPHPRPTETAPALPQAATLPAAPTPPPPALTPEVAALQPVARPRARPDALAAAYRATRAPLALAPEPPSPAATAQDTAMTPLSRPAARPSDLVTRAAAPAVRQKSGGLFGKRKEAAPKATMAGSVCGDPAIRGEKISRIASKVNGCGIEEPVRVTMVDGIRLSQPATLDCTTAKALKTWIDRGLRPAYGQRDVVELKVAAHYICRPRNNVRGAKVSEHGRGKAIDISGIVTSDGKTRMVLGGFDKTMRTSYKAACGIFGTTLGPGSDGYHEDHMHFDTASYRNGAYCR